MSLVAVQFVRFSILPHTQALFEAHHLRMGYVNFVLKATRGRIALINYNVVDMFGTEGSKRYRELGAYPQCRDSSHEQSESGSLPMTQQDPQQ